MLRFSKYVLPAAAFVGLSITAVGLAQPPDGAPPKSKGERKDFFKKQGPPPGGPREEGRGGEPRSVRLDPAVEAWAKTLIEKMNDRHDTIRESARAGLVAVGRPALPLLRPIADGDDGALATAATKVIERIETGERPRFQIAFGPMGGPPMGPDGPPMPPMGEGRPPMGEGRPPMGEGRPPFPPPFGPDGRPMIPGPGGPGGGRPMALENAIAKIDLDDKQKGQVKEILEEHQTRMRDMFEKVRDGKINREEMGDAFRERHEEFMKDLREVLSEDQMKQFRELLPPPPQGGPGGRPGAGGFPGRPGAGPEGRPGPDGRPGRPPVPPKD